MNCWKSININNRYGNQKIAILSLLTMLLSFIVIYTGVSTGVDGSTLDDNNVFPFILGIILMYPFHKLLHLLPLLCVKSKIKMQKNHYLFFPLLTIKIYDPIRKSLFILTLITPFIIFTALMLIGAVLFPSYIHYSTILLSLHIGMCVSDFIKLKNILSSPRKCMIEEYEDQIQLLIPKP
ncbi:MAG: DUF3267 domain-containing protein [Bacillus sp. (in: firmicutes)]